MVTSRARTTRRRLVGLDAGGGQRGRARPAGRRGPPRRRAVPPRPSRAADPPRASGPGSSRSSTTARRYRPVPPTSRARFPRPRCRPARRAPRPGSRADRELLIRFHHVQQVVRHRHGGRHRRRLGRADVHAPVHAHRVHRHQLGFGPRRARAKASADFPDAVGPTRATCPGAGREHRALAHRDGGMGTRRRPGAVTRTSSPRR